MLKRSYSGIPAPPGAGLTKIADPRKVALGWLVFLVVVVLLGAVTWPYGTGRVIDDMRRQFVAYGYLREAQIKAQAVPVQREAALAALNRATELAPKQSAITDTAAQLYIGLRAYKESIPWLRQTVPSSPLVRVSLGQSLLMTGQREEGERLLTQVVREAQDSHRAGTMPPQLYALLLNNVGYVRVLAGLRLPESTRLIAAAVEIQPQQPAYIDSFGWAQYQLGNYLDAAFYLERAVRLYLPGESAEMYYHLGAAYARLGRKQAARVALQKALALDPTLEEATRELKNLSQDLPYPALAMLIPSNCG
ncbi:MAG: tetratricopeptide repeat protein [Armatimonadota bacterium]